MIVVADASPLIFLAKIHKLELLPHVLGEDIRIPRAVVKEVLDSEIPSAEREELEAFINTCSVEHVRRPESYSRGMSMADNAALTLVVRHRADYLLCDEHLMRKVAQAEGVRCIGTLGVIVRAQRQNRITRQEAIEDIDRLIKRHHFRISIEVYQAVMSRLSQQQEDSCL